MTSALLRRRIFRGLRLGDWRYRALILAASLWRRLLFRTTVVAITGSLGKTTCKELLAAILRSHGSTLASDGTANSVKAVAQTILRTRPWHRFLVVEVGTDRPGWIRRSALIANPDIAVILNVGRTHTDRFPSLEDTAREKASLLGGLRRRGVAVLNQDDSRVAAMLTGRARRVVWYGLGEAADVRASDVSDAWPERLALTITADGAGQRIQTQLVGAHWVNSLLGATAAALQCGVSLPRVAAASAQVTPTPGRLDPRPAPSGAVILRDDLNGSIDSFGPAFEFLGRARARRKFLAVTTVTDSPESWGERLRRLASDAKRVVDVLVLIGKPKDTKSAANAAIESGLARDQLHCFPTLAEAAAFFRSCLQEGDLVLLRGRAKDHVGRIYHAQTSEVRCWIDDCQKLILCDDCPELFAPASSAGGLVQLQPGAPVVGGKGNG